MKQLPTSHKKPPSSILHLSPRHSSWFLAHNHPLRVRQLKCRFSTIEIEVSVELGFRVPNDILRGI